MNTCDMYVPIRILVNYLIQIYQNENVSHFSFVSSEIYQSYSFTGLYNIVKFRYILFSVNNLKGIWTHACLIQKFSGKLFSDISKWKCLVNFFCIIWNNTQFIVLRDCSEIRIFSAIVQMSPTWVEGMSPTFGWCDIFNLRMTYKSRRYLQVGGIYR